MDIYDKMCFTVSSAGGRRGAQMGTFDVGHPDAMEFIRAKRENGRLRQFNLSLLITDEFMQAVRERSRLEAGLPVHEEGVRSRDRSRRRLASSSGANGPRTKTMSSNEDGLVACKIYKTLPARRLWDVIMTSTYDFAEPGFILIDRSTR
jgi:ribonucleoside-diphosphate reductase alpha chain